MAQHRKISGTVKLKAVKLVSVRSTEEMVDDTIYP